jgi:hypothetical protein
MAIEPTLGEATRFPGGKKVAFLVVLLVVVMGALVWRPKKAAPKLPSILADIGDPDLAVERLSEELGGTARPDELPVDLTGLPSGSGSTVENIAIPVPPLSPDSPTPLPDLGMREAGRLRPIDVPKARAAYQAGDHEYLVSIFRDESYQVAGRVFAMTLAALATNFEAEGSLKEVFEGVREPFALRETAAYGLLRRDPIAFANYLVRVLERPEVASGQEAPMARLVILGFYMDRWVLDGRAMDQVGDRIMKLARGGSLTANAALSLGLSSGGSSQEVSTQLRGYLQHPTVSDSLVRYYQTMVNQGKSEFEGPLHTLRERISQGL